MLAIPEPEKKKILKHYLGRLAVGLTLETQRIFSEKFKKQGSVYAVGNPRFLRSVGCYLLLAFGMQKHRFVFSYELVDAFLGAKTVDEDPEENRVFYDTQTPLLVIYHMGNTMENRQLENMVCHTITQRHLEDKPTIVLSEVRLQKVEAVFKGLGIAPYSGGSPVQSGSAEF